MLTRNLAIVAAAFLGCSGSDNTVAEQPYDSGAPPEDTGIVDSGSDVPTDVPTKLTSITVKSTKSAGDFKMSGSLGLDSQGRLTVTLAAIRDPEEPTQPVDPAKTKFTVFGNRQEPFSCTIGEVSSSQKAMADLVFINDTTGSMSGAVNGIKTSVQAFAESLVSGGIDAKYSMYTYGDAFATVKEGTTFVIGKGDFPTSMDVDGTERPYVGLTGLETFKGFLAEFSSCGCLGTGGGDAAENTLGALAYANTKVAFRDGAARYYIAIGDNPSHQPGDGWNIPSPWTPPKGDDFVTALGGSAVIHVVGRESTSTTYYPLRNLAERTGGAFLTLPSDGKVDLNALHLEAWLTTSFAGTCTDPQGGTYDIVVKAKITGSDGIYNATLTFEVELH
ncbi:MAG: hypothetical protein ACXWP4_18120 [Polyangiales bacterium]